MNDQTDLDLRLTRWLTEQAEPRAPERLIHATRQRIAATSQTRWARDRRFGLPTIPARLGVVALLGLALVVGLGALATTRLAPSNDVPGAIQQTVSPSPPTPSPSRPTVPPARSQYECSDGGVACLGPLQPGNHATHEFAPSVSYTVPAGWTNTTDGAGEVDLSWNAGGSYTYPDGIGFHDGISIFRRPVATSPSTGSPVPGVGSTAADLTQWLVSHPDIVTSGRAAVAVGGAHGYRISIALPKSPRSGPDTCTDHGVPACESLFQSDAPGGFGIVGPESVVIYLLDTPSGDTVMVVIDDVDGVDRAALIAAATPVVEGLVFSP